MYICNPLYLYDASLVEPLTKLYKHIYKQQFNVHAEP